MEIRNSMRIRRIVLKSLAFLFVAILLYACNVYRINTSVPGITYVASLGNPKADSVVWSPVDSTKILVSAISLVGHDSRVYILDITTKKKMSLIDTDYSGVFGDNWSPDGNQVALSVDGPTKEFSHGGLWVMNTADKSVEMFSDKSSGVVWLPGGDEIALMSLDLASNQNPRRISIYLMDVETRKEELIYSNQKAIAFSGFSLSSDGKYLVVLAPSLLRACGM